LEENQTSLKYGQQLLLKFVKLGYHEVIPHFAALGVSFDESLKDSFGESVLDYADQ